MDSWLGGLISGEAYKEQFIVLSKTTKPYYIPKIYNENVRTFNFSYNFIYNCNKSEVYAMIGQSLKTLFRLSTVLLDL